MKKSLFRYQSLFLISFFLFQGCNQASFKDVVSKPSSIENNSISEEVFSRENEDLNPIEEEKNENNLCIANIQNVSQPIKVIFAVDTSGSNSRGDKFTEPTDPDKLFRKDKILEFVQKFEQNTYLSWQFITFSRSEALSHIDMPFSPNPQDVYSSLNDFLSNPDGGATPYNATFKLIHDLITKDQKENKIASSYAIVFISDGRPTDYCPNLIGQTATCEEPDLNALVDDFKKLIGSLERTTFNAIYYGEHDPIVAKTLQEISLLGKGQFVDTNESSRNIHLDSNVNVLISCKE